MGQADSKPNAVNRFINAPEAVSKEAIEGFLLTSPVPLAVIDAFPSLKVIARADWNKDRVAVISCGGSGHEPSNIDLVGEGVLTAVACGRVWREPTSADIAEAIAAVSGPEGCLIVIPNYFDLRLNVGLAIAQIEETLGVRLRLVIVKDDVASMGEVHGREHAKGIAGIVPILKIAGAAAAAGLSLDEVYQEAEGAANQIVSMGVAYNRGSAYIEAWTSEVSESPGEIIEIGVGVHGEPGVLRVPATATAKDIVGTMLKRLSPCFPTTGELFVMLNNLGAVPRIEMALLAKEILESELGARIALFAGPAAYCTALNTNGFSLSILPLDNGRKEKLMANTKCRGWVSPVVPTRCFADVSKFPRASLSPATCERRCPSNNPEVRRILMQVANALNDAQEELSQLSAKTGTGKLGFTLAQFAKQLLARMDELPLACPRQLFSHLAELSGLESGVFFSLSKVLFSTAANDLKNSFKKADTGWDFELVVTALRKGAWEAQKVAGVGLNRRTLLDALIPALRVEFISPGRHGSNGSIARWLEIAASQARRGARATAQMMRTSPTDTAAHLPLSLRAGCPDGGAMAVAVIFTAVDTPREVEFRVLPEGEKPLGEDDDDKAEARAKAEFANFYKLQEEEGDDDEDNESSFKRIHFGTCLTGQRAGSEVMVTELKIAGMRKLGLNTFQERRVIDQKRMLNWLFREKTNVVKVFEVVVTPLTYIYVTEKPAGHTLMELLKSKEELPYERIAVITKQILNAVKSLHNNRMIHRDLKPESFMFDICDTLKLTDVCGMVYHLSESYEAEFEQGTVCGTLAYMSPEALVGCARQGSDLWAVGVMLHLMLSGALPFHVQTIEEAIKAHQEPVDVLHGDTRARWRDVPEVARELVQGLLQRNARHRFTVDQALEHSFVQGATGAPDGAAPRRQITPSIDIGSSIESPSSLRNVYDKCQISGVSKLSWQDLSRSPSVQITKTLYLIRHGEAIHNIAEKAAKKKAAEKALDAKLLKGTKEYEELVEAARKSVLDNPDFYDAMLSQAGQLDAERCKLELESLRERGLPMPTVVFTSPLQRTLQTAAAIFPYHSNVHAREDLRERRTGLPCDSRSAVQTMSNRPSFQQIDFNAIPEGSDDGLSEDKAALRIRCTKFLQSLGGGFACDESGEMREHDAICLVTHKGFLRELERGALGHPEATEFMNCELRIYTVTWSIHGVLESPSKCLYSNASLSTIRLRNFPASWVSEDSLGKLPDKVRNLLAEFGDLRETPEVWKEEGGLRVTAAFTEQSAAQAASLRLHGLDIRSEEEKRARSTIYESDRLHAQVLFDIL